MSQIQSVYDCACEYRSAKDGGGDVSTVLDRLVSLVAVLTPADVGLSADDVLAPTNIECVNVAFDQACSITIFIIPAETALPLHDHPDMIVVTKILLGRVRIRSFDWVEPPPSCLPAPKCGSVRSSGDVIADSRTAPLLVSAYSRQLHEVSAIDVSVMFDVITPPYDGTADDDTDDDDGASRLCHYFKRDTPHFLTTIPPPQTLAFTERPYTGPSVRVRNGMY